MGDRLLDKCYFPENFNPRFRSSTFEREKEMFFVRGLTSNGKGVFVNPDQVLYVCSNRSRNRAVLMLTHGQRLIVDQDTETVNQRFEEYLREVGDPGEDEPPGGDQRTDSTQSRLPS
jgi:uncharacterized protein YlzI (FlbEa/FlbD family)